MGPYKSYKSYKMDQMTAFSFQLLFGKNGRLILRAKDEKDHPDCYQ